MSMRKAMVRVEKFEHCQRRCSNFDSDVQSDRSPHQARNLLHSNTASASGCVELSRPISSSFNQRGLLVQIIWRMEAAHLAWLASEQGQLVSSKGEQKFK